MNETQKNSPGRTGPFRRMNFGSLVGTALTAAAVGLVVSGFLLTQSFANPEVGGIVLFAGVAAGVVVLSGMPKHRPTAADHAFPLVLLLLGVAPALLSVMEVFHPRRSARPR
jgi:hypothetical protein